MPILQGWLRLAGATAALPAPLPSPPAQTYQRQVTQQLDRSLAHSASEALPLHCEGTVSEKASGVLVSRTGASELVALGDQNLRAVRVSYFL